MTSVQELKKVPFSSLPIEKKVELKNRGRPTPEFSLVRTENKKNENRTFQRQLHSAVIYNKNSWICGNGESKSFYCFPCLLFSHSKKEDKWIKTGVVDIKHLHEKIRKHERSQEHINSIMDLEMLGKVNVMSCLNEQYSDTVRRHNMQVEKNRQILKRLITCVRFCSNCELPLRGHNEEETSLNPGVFKSLVNFTAELDSVMKQHLETATVFKGTSKTIQNDILDCMLDVCRDEISEQIRMADFLGIQCDETTDISNHCQLVIVLRYIYNCLVCERFWGFLSPSDKTANGITETILQQINPLIGSCHQKLISQSYDGANVFSGSVGGVQTKIREHYPVAYYVHCYAHKLNLVMEQATNHISRVRIFFSNLSSIPAFFSNSSQRSKFLEEIVQKRLPRVAVTRWNYNIRTVNVVYENREKLIECLEEIEDECKNKVTLNEASGLRRTLSDPEFVFFLHVFHRLLPHVDILYNQMQARKKDSVQIANDICTFERFIIRERTHIDEIHKEIKRDFPEPVRKRKKEDACDTRSVAAKEICDIVATQVKDRFSFTGHLEASVLVNTVNFEVHSKEFPQDSLRKVCSFYPMLEEEKLKTELKVMYQREDFRNIRGASNLLKFLIVNNLITVFSESSKLLKIIITTPMTTAESERCFSTLKRIKSFLRSTMANERLNALAMMSISKNMVHNIADFDEKVMEKFVKLKQRRMDFEFKK